MCSSLRQSLCPGRNGGWVLQIGLSLSELILGSLLLGVGLLPNENLGCYHRDRGGNGYRNKIPGTSYNIQSHDEYHCPPPALNGPLSPNCYCSWCQFQYISQKNERMNITTKGREGHLVFIRWGTLCPVRSDRSYPWKRMREQERWV